jgi:hypothetical protein
MAFSPNLFLSNAKGKDGFARPCRFEVLLPIPRTVTSSVGNSIIEKIINFPNSVFSDVTDAITSAAGGTPTNLSSVSRYLALQCESAELPGKTLQTADVKIYGPSFKVPYQTQYQETTLTFLCTNDFYERKLFDAWLESIHPSDTNNMRFPKGTGMGDGYMVDLKVVQYDDFIKQIYAVQMIDAFPVGIASQPLNWGEDGFHRLSVQFAYQKYKTIAQGSYNLADAATSLFGSAASRLLPIGSALTL